MTADNDIQFASDLRTVLVKVIKKLRKASPAAQTLSLTERSVMGSLYQHKVLLPSELAAMEMITNQSISTVLNHLLELGFIIRMPSETDKRKVKISLSEQGERALLQFRHERDEWLLAAISQTCTDEEKAVLKQVIAPLSKLIEYK